MEPKKLDVMAVIRGHSMKFWATIVACVIAAIIFIVGFGQIGAFFNDPFGFKKREAEATKIESALARGDAVESRAQSGLTIDNAAIASNRRKRDSIGEEIHRENSDNIRKAEGANTPLSSDLITRVNDGLCDYEPTPGCPSS